MNQTESAKDATEKLAYIREWCAWIVEHYGDTLRSDEKSYGSTHDVLVGRLILAEDILRIAVRE